MIEILWKRHFHSGLAGSYHGDMAAAFDAMLKDSDIDEKTVEKMWESMQLHMTIERGPQYAGRKWFCERFGYSHELLAV